MGWISRLRLLAARGLTRLAGFAGGYYTWLGGMAVAALLLTIFALPLLSGLPLPWDVNFDGLPEKDAAEATVAAWDFVLKAAGGIVLIAGLFVAWRRTEAATVTARAAARTAEASEQGQITERFTRATELLGSINEHTGPNIEMRLGGIYAMEQIVRDAPHKYHWQIIEVLTAYVRECVPLNGEQRDQVREDVQAALNVIGRLGPTLATVGPTGMPLDKLSWKPLQPIILRSVWLRRGEFGGANLSESVFVNAELQEAIFWGADLRNAAFGGANLKGAHFFGAKLLAAQFINAKLQNADFKEANLSGAVFSGAELQYTDLGSATGFTREQLCSAGSFDATTKLPNHLEGMTMAKCKKENES